MLIETSIESVFILANSGDPDRNSAGSSMFAKVSVSGFPVYKGFIK